MRLKLEIRENSTGIVATDVWEDWEYNTYWWEDGNAFCDCNRSLFFSQAQGTPSPDIDETVCSDGAYSVRLLDADSGEVLYDELEENK